MKWFNDEIRQGENGILIYPNSQTFSQIYSQYVREQLEKENEEDNNNNIRNEQSKPRIIILIATFYETIDSVKNHLSDVGVDAQKHTDNGSLVIVDAFKGYYPDLAGMKKLVTSLSERSCREGRVGVTALIDMGFFFLFGGDGRATELLNYEASLPSKTKGSNVRGFSCYHGGNYTTLKDDQKKELAQGQKKVLEITESVA